RRRVVRRPRGRPRARDAPADRPAAPVRRGPRGSGRDGAAARPGRARGGPRHRPRERADLVNGGPRHGPPNPPTLGTSRRSRDAPRSRVTRWAPTPPTFEAARLCRAASLSPRASMGPRSGWLPSKPWRSSMSRLLCWPRETRRVCRARCRPAGRVLHRHANGRPAHLAGPDRRFVLDDPAHHRPRAPAGDPRPGRRGVGLSARLDLLFRQGQARGHHAVPRRGIPPTMIRSTLSVTKRTSLASRGMVVAEHPRGAEVGARILERGGNAVDAAVATAFAMTVVEPFMSTIAGAGTMLVHLAKRGETVALDFNGMAPLRAQAMMYKTIGGVSEALFPWPNVEGQANVYGHRSVA